MMLSLGNFKFSLDTLAWEQATTGREWLWPSASRLGRAPALQYAGEGERTLELRGVTFPAWKGADVSALTSMAGHGKPHVLVDGTGRVLGQWVITRLQEEIAHPTREGQPRKRSWTLSLKYYGEDA